LYRVLVFAIVCSLLVASGLQSLVSTQGSIVFRVLWFAESNPSSGDDLAASSCIIGDKVFFIGSQSLGGNARFRVESRFRSNGSLVNSWVYDASSGDDVLGRCIWVQGSIYVSGASQALPPKAYLIVLDPNLGNPNVKDLGWLGLAASIAYDGSYIYVGGGDLNLGTQTLTFRVDKIRVSDLSRVAFYRSQNAIQGYHRIALSIAYDNTSSMLWLVGASLNPNNLSDASWWIEIINATSMRFIKSIDLNMGGYPTSVIIVGEYIYITGDNGQVYKFNRNGEVVKATNLPSNIFKSTTLSDYIVLIGHRVESGASRLTLHILDKDLNEITSTIIDNNIRGNSYVSPGNIAVDSNTLYIPAINNAPGNNQWLLYAIRIEGEQLVTTTTTTVTETRTITKTETRTETKTTTETRTATITQTVTATRTDTITQTETKTETKTSTLTQTLTETKTITQTTTHTETKIEPTPITLTKYETQTITATETKITTDTRLITTTLQIPVTQTRTILEKQTLILTQIQTITQELYKEKTITETVERIQSTPILALAVVILLVAGILAAILLRK